MKISAVALIGAVTVPGITAYSVNRRSFLGQVAGVSACVPTLANAGLLDEFGTDPTKIVQEESKKPVTPVVPQKKSESVIEPNLRSNYYYPTNKKRYLPRIQKCSNMIPNVADLLGSQDWEAVDSFAKTVADDTILPLKLYTSSLTGGGTNVKVSYTKDMYACADQFESNQKRLLKAISKKDTALATEALEGMSEALSKYRTVAGLKDDMGDLPSVDDIRRAASRTQKLTFEGKMKERDQRAKAASS
ncbi:hypothetical protein FisN_5Hh286 [Fistulifera solaris]|jgi:hypothetical protein|uniref:Uncharacterized protein n=1 Tax=Fistulifera solaris TaxID=1519565 RepID=A0A1Z5JSI5_FISSO|nr:hypothetical protein FisN_5Hh286 [Fistulifera solaris]|eukprot:GAX16909.1 hypothetical protein FisN_5Hh286 [Fistulifera solaris]